MFQLKKHTELPVFKLTFRNLPVHSCLLPSQNVSYSVYLKSPAFKKETRNTNISRFLKAWSVFRNPSFIRWVKENYLQNNKLFRH